jgi:adenosylcobinamide-phosphate synthase
MKAALLCVCAILLDHWLGEPRRWHPLVGFGCLAQQTEALCYGPLEASATVRRLRGVAAWLILIIPVALLAWGLATIPYVGEVTQILLLYLALGGKSLGQHAQAVVEALRAGDLPLARAQVGRIVSRDTEALNEEQLCVAAVESVLENGCDAVFGALFWFVVGGAPGVVLYRLANTLDALWGYRTPRYRDFGWAAARLDDVFNGLPARLTALSYTLLGDHAAAWRCWRRQGPTWKSHNAGTVMAAGAGALGLQLGGVARYYGECCYRPPLGEGQPPSIHDIDRAVALVRRSVWLWLGVIFLGGWWLA